eukprot:c27870_g2_i1 orf=332-1240(+)
MVRFVVLLCSIGVLIQAFGAVGLDFQCEAPFESHLGLSNLYAKVTEPTLAPFHLRDLPGFTRSVYKRDHAVISPESQVFSALPGWAMTLGAYLISPAMGSDFSMYIANMKENATSGLPLDGIERFVFVVKGEIILSTSYEGTFTLHVDWFAYLPPNFKHFLSCTSSATIVVFERRYYKLQDKAPDFIVGATDKQPVVEAPGEVFVLRKLLPASIEYDFNVHVMDFKPGEYLNVKEVHYNQHGLLLLEGHGIYRLGDNWYPVQAGDAIWMGPFVPQWFGALGQTTSRYLLYKDVNRDPFVSYI